MFYLAKLMQAVGCVDVGYALWVGLSDEQGMGRELKIALVGIAVFYLGRLLESRLSA